MTGTLASWLPPELTVVQPYAMGALMGCPPVQNAPCPVTPSWFVAPASGTCVGMDRPELMIATCFVAPAAVQADARKRGEKAMIMMLPKGLMERLEDDPKLWPRRPKLAPVSDIGGGLVAPEPQATAFVDALMALEEDD